MTKMIMRKVMAVMVIVCMVATVMPFMSDSADAATKTKSKTYGNYVLDARGPISCLDIYGKDIFKIKYNEKKIVSVKCSQAYKNLDTKMCEKGGIKLVKKSSSKWVYRSVWYVNFDVLPKKIRNICGSYIGKAVNQLSNLGRCFTVTTEYTIDKNGKVTWKQVSYKLYLPKKLQKAAKFIINNMYVLGKA